MMVTGPAYFTLDDLICYARFFERIEKPFDRGTVVRLERARDGWMNAIITPVVVVRVGRGNYKSTTTTTTTHTLQTNPSRGK